MKNLYYALLKFMVSIFTICFGIFTINIAINASDVIAAWILLALLFINISVSVYYYDDCKMEYTLHIDKKVGKIK